MTDSQHTPHPGMSVCPRPDCPGWEQPWDDPHRAVREQAEQAEKHLLQAVADACPGPHGVRQHRDGNKSWCPVCGFTERGFRVATPQTATLAPGGATPAESEPAPSSDGASALTSAEVVSPCVECGRMDGAHGLVHVRNPQGGGGRNVRCSREVVDLSSRRPCPTCSPPSRETVNMVCQTCGWDYSNGEKP